MGHRLMLVRCRFEQLKHLWSVTERREASNFHRLRAAFYERFWRKAAQNIGAEIEGLGHGFFRITKAGKWTLVNLYHVMLDDHLTLEMAGNKPLTHRFLLEAGCRTPQFSEYDLNTLDKAREFLRRLGGSAVVKPAFGTGTGCGVTTKIRSEARLKKASVRAAHFNRSMMIQEEVPGDSYRLLYLDGKLIDAVRRDPPAMTGDGQRSIRQLMEDETAERLRDMATFRALSPLALDLEAVFSLQDQGLTPGNILGFNQRIVVKSVVNQNCRWENHSVREKVHPSLEQLGSRLVTALGVRLAGVDLITSAINVPLEENGGFIHEMNTTPGLHHHVLVADPSKIPPVGELILDHILSSTQRHILTAPLADNDGKRSLPCVIPS